MDKLFGTDGIRGVANQYPLTPAFVTRIGQAIGRVLGAPGEHPLALIGRDTRLSGPMIEHALAAGLMAQGFHTLHVGVLTTPAIAFLTRTHRARCGISISASHNPFQDNGIKVFGADGFKIPDERENEIEAIALSDQEMQTPAASLAQHTGTAPNGAQRASRGTVRCKCQPTLEPEGLPSGKTIASQTSLNSSSLALSSPASSSRYGSRDLRSDAVLGQRRDDATLLSTYEEFLCAAVQDRSILEGQRIALDCNNGATFALAPRVLQRLGAQVVALNDQPDGVNINQGYDALEPQRLRETVLREQAAWGVQFDGDGDRSVFVDERGHYVDGDFVLAILARDWSERGRLETGAVVSTVMANVGLEESLRSIGATLERTAVGDRWVTERMRATGTRIGGEQSGHIVLFDGGHTTGDGLYTALRLAEVMARRGASLSALAGCMHKYPQVLINVRVPNKPPLEQIPAIQAQLARARAVLGAHARILLRYSGTENLARVMIEGMDATAIAREAEMLSEVIRQNIV